MLKIQNEDLSAKLRRTEVVLSRVKEELARFRASIGKNPCTEYDEEQRLSLKLKVSKCWGWPTSVVEGAGGQFISVRESLTP
jgi:hypothetical protein